MRTLFNSRIVCLLILGLCLLACTKTSSEADANNAGGGTGTGSGSGTTITENTTTVRVGGQPLPGQAIWLGTYNGLVYGHVGSIIFRLNPTTRRMEEAFRISFPDITVSDVRPRFIKLTPEGDLFMAVKAPDNSTLVSRLTIDGQKVWSKRVSFSYNQFYQERHIDASNLNVFDNAVWLTCFRALVKMDLQTGSVLATTQLPFASQEMNTPNDVLPAGDQVVIYCRNGLQHLDLFFFDKNTLSFSHSLGRKIIRNGSVGNNFGVKNVFLLPNNRLLFLTDYTHTGNAFFPLSFGLVTDYQGNIIRAKYFSDHLNNIVQISLANKSSSGRYFAMIASDVDINLTYTYNIISVDENLNLTQSAALLIGNNNRQSEPLSPYPLDDSRVVLCDGGSFYWLNYQQIGCSKDPLYRFSVPQMDMTFSDLVRSTTPPSFAPGITFRSVVDVNVNKESLSITQSATECKR